MNRKGKRQPPSPLRKKTAANIFFFVEIVRETFPPLLFLYAQSTKIKKELD